MTEDERLKQTLIELKSDTPTIRISACLLKALMYISQNSISVNILLSIPLSKGDA